MKKLLTSFLSLPLGKKTIALIGTALIAFTLYVIFTLAWAGFKWSPSLIAGLCFLFVLILGITTGVFTDTVASTERTAWQNMGFAWKIFSLSLAVTVSLTFVGSAFYGLIVNFDVWSQATGGEWWYILVAFGVTAFCAVVGVLTVQSWAEKTEDVQASTSAA